MLFQEMEDFTLFDGLVPSSGLLDFSPAVEEQLESGILFPGDSLVKNDVSPGDLFEDFLSDNTLEDPFSQEWMEISNLTSLVDETTNSPNKSTVGADKVSSIPTGGSRLLEELLTKPIKIKSSPTVSPIVQLDSKSENDTSVHIKFPEEGMETDNQCSILEQAINEIDGLDALILQQQLHDIYDASVASTDTIANENTSSEISLIDSNNEFLIASPLSSEDIDSILSCSEPASPSSSVQYDPDYIPSSSPEKRSKRSCKSSKASKSRESPYDKPIEKMDRKERKRIQNRNAAIRYREKKRAERGTIHSEEDILQDKNKELKTKVEHLSNEINYMKTLLTEVCEARGLKIKFK